MQGKYENAEKIIVSDNAEIPVYKGILYEFMSNNLVIKTIYEPASKEENIDKDNKTE